VQLDPKYTLNLQEPSAEDKKAAAVAQKKAFEDRFVGTLSIDQNIMDTEETWQTTSSRR
jgi:hypothetical protein